VDEIEKENKAWHHIDQQCTISADCDQHNEVFETEHVVFDPYEAPM